MDVDVEVNVAVRTLAAPYPARPSNAQPSARERYVSSPETGFAGMVEGERSVDIRVGERRRMRDWRVRYVEEVVR